jgi:hypothetical protein
MADLPSGTVTFLFTVIESSTERWERDAAVMGTAVERHLTHARAATESHGGKLYYVNRAAPYQREL